MHQFQLNLVSFYNNYIISYHIFLTYYFLLVIEQDVSDNAAAVDISLNIPNIEDNAAAAVDKLPIEVAEVEIPAENPDQIVDSEDPNRQQNLVEIDPDSRRLCEKTGNLFNLIYFFKVVNNFFTYSL